MSDLVMRMKTLPDLTNEQAWEVVNEGAREIENLRAQIDRTAERFADRVIALDGVLQWWDGLPPNLRQDIEGSGAKPGCIAAIERLLNS